MDLPRLFEFSCLRFCLDSENWFWALFNDCIEVVRSCTSWSSWSCNIFSCDGDSEVNWTVWGSPVADIMLNSCTHLTDHFTWKLKRGKIKCYHATKAHHLQWHHNTMKFTWHTKLQIRLEHVGAQLKKTWSYITWCNFQPALCYGTL